MDLCTISGVIFDVAGEPKSGVAIFIVKTLKDDVVINQRQTEVALSDEDGAVSFTVPRDSTIYLYGSFFINGNSFLVENTGLAVSIPDSATANLEDLATPVGDAILFPSALISSDAGNALVAGTDDKIFVPANDGGPPTGSAGGVLAGSYPNPSFAVNMATQAELDAVASAAASDATTKANAAEANAIVASEKWALNFTSDGDAYIPAIEEMTINLGNTAIGTGSLAYEKSTTGSPDVFTSTSLPATLQAGAWLKVTASGVSGFLAVQLRRTA